MISNHPDLGPKAQAHGIPFHHLPVTKGAKAEQEAQVAGVSAGARDRRGGPGPLHADPRPSSSPPARRPILNIHHSFLPAFVGPTRTARPHVRVGVKVIGVTCTTCPSWSRPIIHQDVVHVSHRDRVEDMVRVGREVERRVLARAVRLHLEDRVLVDGSRTVVFE